MSEKRLDSAALLKQRLRNLLPFRLLRFLADWLARSSIPIGCVGGVSFFAMQVGVNPRAVWAFVLLGGLVSARPVAFCVPPESGEGVGETLRRARVFQRVAEFFE